MIRTLDQIVDGAAYDCVVLGAGAGGMAAAAFAALDGARVLLVERTGHLGGTTALSAASAWIPNSLHAATVGAEDTVENASRYLSAVVGNHAPRSLRDAFLESGPAAIARLERDSDVHFRPYATHPDYEQQHEGATLRGRALEPLPFNGRQLGEDLGLIRPPIPEFTILGGMMVDRTDIGHLLKLGKNLASTLHAVRILGRYGLDRLAGRRGTRLVMGNALIGRMLLTLKKRGVDILVRTETRELVAGPAGVEGVVLESEGVVRRVQAARGVVLAGGGFTRHPARRAEMLHAPAPAESPCAPGATGALQDLALRLGARFGEGAQDHAFWAPVSIRKRADGSTAVFPHFVMDRSKPGTVCVNQAGRRFVNESTSYHLFAKAMFEANGTAPCIPSFIVTDAAGLRKYGLGMVRMGAKTLRPFLDDGYLVEGRTLAELAGKLGIDAAALESTVAAMNAFAETGVDPEFGRGSTAYHRANGDAAAGLPNPTLGRIDAPPFYAVRLYPADIGAATGLAVDPWAQVLKADDRPIGRLYACGNEAHSVMGGTYPGPGVTIGPAIAFAYRAVQHALGRTTE
ncbi:FAD-dependent oxidoreductase [Alsobacter sp. SYSU BS001988]